MVEPSPTITATFGEISIAINKGTWDANVAVNGPTIIFKNPNEIGIISDNATNNPASTIF